MSRNVLIVFAVGLVCFTPLAALAAGSPLPAPTFAAGPDDRAQGGMVEGRVTNVDYTSGVISIDSPHGKVDVATMPTTSVTAADPGYHTITDVSKGSKVMIFISRTGAGKLIAQIIHLLHR